MPDAKTRLELDRTFTANEYQRLERGLIPQQMEDKWFIYLEGEWLSFHRSWTGYCIYRVRLRQERDTYAVTEAWVNRDFNQYRSRNDRVDLETLTFLIERLLLGKDVPFPSGLGYEGGLGRTSARTHSLFGTARANDDNDE